MSECATLSRRGRCSLAAITYSKHTVIHYAVHSAVRTTLPKVQRLLICSTMEDVRGECEEADWLSQSNGLQVAVKDGGIALLAPPSRCKPLCL